MYNVLALDLGSATGWASRHNGVVTSGTFKPKMGRFDGGGMRYLRFKHWLDEMLPLVGPIHRLVYEEVRNHKGVDAAHVYGGLMAHLTAWCEANAIPYEGIPVGTIKKHATGKGNSGKELVIAAVQRLGFTPCDDNEADALALLDFCVYALLSADEQGGKHIGRVRRVRGAL